jgi:hypothetical protein
VAIIGSLVGTIFTHQLSGSRVLEAHGAALAHTATGSVAAADAVAAQVGGTTGSSLAHAAHEAFVTGMATGMRLGGAVALAGAVACALALPARRSGGLATMSLASAAEAAA